MYAKLKELKYENDIKKSSPGAKIYNMRMYDIVLDSHQPTMSPEKMVIFIKKFN